MRMYMCAYATFGAAVYTSVAGCAHCIRVHMPTVAVKVQTCWTFKASADQCWHSKALQGHREPTNWSAYWHMRTYIDAYAHGFILLSTAQLVLCSGDAKADASVDICAGCRHIRTHGVQTRLKLPRVRQNRDHWLETYCMKLKKTVVHSYTMHTVWM